MRFTHSDSKFQYKWMSRGTKQKYDVKKNAHCYDAVHCIWEHTICAGDEKNSFHLIHFALDYFMEKWVKAFRRWWRWYHNESTNTNYRWKNRLSAGWLLFFCLSIPIRKSQNRIFVFTVNLMLNSDKSVTSAKIRSMSVFPLKCCKSCQRQKCVSGFFQYFIFFERFFFPRPSLFFLRQPVETASLFSAKFNWIRLNALQQRIGCS